MKPATARTLRQFHFYLGMFFAPAIIFFALSGALQTFRLQEEKGYGGTPPSWIVWIASVHKDQKVPRGTPLKAGGAVSEGDDHHHDDGDDDHDAHHVEGGHDAAAPAAKPETSKAPAKPPAATFPLKVFVGIMSIGLMLSATLGIVIALTNRAMRRMSVFMLAAGSLLPLALLLA